MIVFDLGCAQGHRFEGWFTSSEDFESQQQGQLLSCPLCGDQAIQRLVTAPRVNTGRVAPQDSQTDTGQYANFDPEKLRKVITHIIENTEDVGAAFPEEARRIHYREAPERRIRGTASVPQVAALHDEGIDVVALPIPPHLAGKPH